MKPDIFILFLSLVSEGVGYSMIAPLFPPLLKEKGIDEDMSGIILSVLALVMIATTPFAAKIIGIYGKLNILYYVTISNVLFYLIQIFCLLTYATIQYVASKYLAITLSIISRGLHGGSICLTMIIAYSASVSLAEAGQEKYTIGLMEIAWCIGMAIGPVFASVLYFIGGFVLPFIIMSLCCAGLSLSFKKINFPLNENKQAVGNLCTIATKPVFYYYIQNIFWNMGAIFLDNYAKTFYLPSLSIYLMTQFGLSVEIASLFFTLFIFSYFILLRYLDAICDKIGNYTIMTLGIAILVVSSLMLVPKNLLIIIFGFFISGTASAGIYVPGICNMIEILKETYSEDQANDISAALFNLGLGLGEMIGPFAGGYFSQEYGFPASCLFTAFISFVYLILFFKVNYQHIIKERENRLGKEKIENIENVKALLTRDSLT